MPTSTHELLALAKQLQTQSGSEACLRGAISRAYYAALHATKDVFDARPRLGEESSHAEIISRAVVYSKSLNPGRQAAIQIAQIMPKIRRTRNRADYELSADIDSGLSQGVIERAEAVLTLCDEIKTKRASGA